jgi:hypothetical protein
MSDSTPILTMPSEICACAPGAATAAASASGAAMIKLRL